MIDTYRRFVTSANSRRIPYWEVLQFERSETSVIELLESIARKESMNLLLFAEKGSGLEVLSINVRCKGVLLFVLVLRIILYRR